MPCAAIRAAGYSSKRATAPGVERPLILLTLGATRGNQIRAAHLLGLNRNTLRKKIRELDIPVVRGLK